MNVCHLLNREPSIQISLFNTSPVSNFKAIRQLVMEILHLKNFGKIFRQTSVSLQFIFSTYAYGVTDS